MKMKTRRGKLVRALSFVPMIGCGVMLGIILGYMEGNFLLNYLMILVVLLGMYIFSTLCHELGHLICGLKSGYRFGMFGVGALTWMKDENGKIRLKRMKTPGIGGMCLMFPPELKDGMMPFKLFYLGGVIVNAILTVLSTVVGLIVWGIAPVAALLLWAFALINLVHVMGNGIPLPGEAVNNDGYNVLAMTQDKECIALHWRAMQIAQQTFRGVQFRDMPDEWFVLPTDEQMKSNPRYAEQGVYYFTRLLSQGKREEAVEVIKRMLENDAAVAGMQKLLMRIDWARCEMLGERRLEVIRKLLNEETRKLMKQMKRSLAVVQTEFIYAALIEHDFRHMEVLEEQFEKLAKKHPFAADVEEARKQMEEVREQALEEGEPTGKIQISYDE